MKWGGGDQSRFEARREWTDDLQDDPHESAPESQYRLKSVIGDDSREHVKNAKRAPYKQIGLIYGYRSTRGRSSASGTGWMISADTMITAAHVVHNYRAYGSGNYGRPERVRAWLGFNDDRPPPYGVLKGRELIVHENYVRDTSNLAADVALIKFEEPISGGHGVLKFGAVANPASEKKILLAGYPQDLQPKPLKLYAAKGAAVSARDGALFHKVDSFKGQSGAPLIIGEGVSAKAIGVHTQGKDEADALRLDANMGVLLEGAMLDWVKKHL